MAEGGEYPWWLEGEQRPPHQNQLVDANATPYLPEIDRRVQATRGQREIDVARDIPNLGTLTAMQMTEVADRARESDAAYRAQLLEEAQYPGRANAIDVLARENLERSAVNRRDTIVNTSIGQLGRSRNLPHGVVENIRASIPRDILPADTESDINRIGANARPAERARIRERTRQLADAEGFVLPEEGEDLAQEMVRGGHYTGLSEALDARVDRRLRTEDRRAASRRERERAENAQMGAYDESARQRQRIARPKPRGGLRRL